MLYYKQVWVNHSIKNIIKHNFCSMTNYTFPNIRGLLTVNNNKSIN